MSNKRLPTDPLDQPDIERSEELRRGPARTDARVGEDAATPTPETPANVDEMEELELPRAAARAPLEAVPSAGHSAPTEMTNEPPLTRILRLLHPYLRHPAAQALAAEDARIAPTSAARASRGEMAPTPAAQAQRREDAAVPATAAQRADGVPEFVVPPRLIPAFFRALLLLIVKEVESSRSCGPSRVSPSRSRATRRPSFRKPCAWFSGPEARTSAQRSRSTWRRDRSKG
jgi:hypothetical protein